ALIGLLTINFNIGTSGHFLGILIILMVNAWINRTYLVEDAKQKMAIKAKTKLKPDALIIQLGVIGSSSLPTEGAMFDWSGVYFSDVVRSPEKLAVLGYAAFMVTMAIGRFAGDKAIARFGRQRTLQVSGLLMFTGMLLSVVLPSIWICTL